ncbi:Retrovirus-related Pol polyprotein from transposon 17.6 [Gossypium australe]|uniref:Retrovirus-related Pol polyprotein from transposon 17.6 n=1 Tax=Gossypium australe TaxID=47621 RepID=A0A5B6VBY8_9ROSI|nr:Retrovirus-related Pol polyprotein from transposon 17.6 [Gossypium australe]
MHKIILEDSKSIEQQRRLNPIMKEVVKKEIIKWLDAGIIYPIPDNSWRCMIAIFSNMVEKFFEVYMDDFLVFSDTFEDCLQNLELVLCRCQETNLVLNWEKCHFMVCEGIVLGHKISQKGIVIDKAKFEVIDKLPPPTPVKGIRSFLDHAGFYR